MVLYDMIIIDEFFLHFVVDIWGPAAPPAPPSCQALFVDHFPCFLSDNPFCQSITSDNPVSQAVSQALVKLSVNQLGYIMSDKGGNCFGRYTCFRGVSARRVSCFGSFSHRRNHPFLRNFLYVMRRKSLHRIGKHCILREWQEQLDHIRQTTITT